MDSRLPTTPSCATRTRAGCTVLLLCAVLPVTTVAAAPQTAPPSAQASPAAVQQQRPALPTNPEAIEFEMTVEDGTRVQTYRLELFRSGTNTLSARADRIVDIPAGSVTTPAAGVLRIDLRRALGGLANGEYVATLRAVTAESESPRSIPTTAFLVSGQVTATRNAAPRNPPNPGIPSAPAPSPEPPQDPADPTGSPGKWWTIVGIITGVAALIVPLIVN